MKVCYAPKAHIIPSEQLTAYARIAGIDAFQPIYLASEVDALVADLKNELMEEARLSGMGSEREARLLARIATLEAALRDIKNVDPSPTQLEEWARWVHARVKSVL